MLTGKRLHEVLRYDPVAGIFYWKVRIGRVRAGDIAGTVTNDGYRRIILDGVRYRAHRLAWFYMTGEWPADQVDHENRLRDDNRWRNLREANNSQNGVNSCERPNLSGYRGVDWFPDRRKFRARIVKNKKYVSLGYFDTPEAASHEYQNAKRRLFGKFAEAALAPV